MSTIVEEARIALAAKGEADHQIAGLAACPPWRHAAFAGLLAGLVGTPAVPLELRFVVLGLIVLGGVLIYLADRRRLGVFINGYRRGKTRLVVVPLMAVWLVLYSASYYFETKFDAPWVSIGLAAVAFMVGYVGSVIWQRTFRRELGA